MDIKKYYINKIFHNNQYNFFSLLIRLIGICNNHNTRGETSVYGARAVIHTADEL